MEKRLATLRAAVSTPERSKFTAPLLLVHGLWSGSWMWQEVAGTLSQRGWEVWALDLRGRPGSRPVDTLGGVRLEDYVEDVVAAAQALWAPPVVCGHDLGALLALIAAAQVTPRALLLLAPVLPRAWVADGRPPLPLHPHDSARGAACARGGRRIMRNAEYRVRTPDASIPTM